MVSNAGTSSVPVSVGASGVAVNCHTLTVVSGSGVRPLVQDGVRSGFAGSSGLSLEGVTGPLSLFGVSSGSGVSGDGVSAGNSSCKKGAPLFGDRNRFKEPKNVSFSDEKSDVDNSNSESGTAFLEFLRI